MRAFVFAKRNTKEILRDPLSYLFGIGFPVVLLVLLTAIQHNIPLPLFELDNLTPGISVFGLSFLALFSAQLTARDRGSSFLARLLTTPMRAADYILGYILPFLPMALLQCGVVIGAACLLGLPISGKLFLLIISILPSALLFVCLGTALGNCLNEKQVGGICGALLTNLSAWVSGIWFDPITIGKGFMRFCELLPFIHSVRLGQLAITPFSADFASELLWVSGYALAFLLLSILLFAKNIKQS